MFLKLSGATLALLNLRGEATGSAKSQKLEATRERLANALFELNEAAGIGLSTEEFKRSQDYVTGVYQEVSAKLRPIVLADDLDLPIQFSAKRRP